MSATVDDAAVRLSAAGLAADAVPSKVALLAATRAALGDARGPFRDYFVPGRIEVLGKHTDYAGGRSLLCAAERGFVVSTSPRGDDRVVVRDVVGDVVGEFRLAPDQANCSHWHNYPATVIRRVARNFAGPFRGIDVAFGSDLPRSAGLSSSTALIIAVFVALADWNELDARADYAANIRSTEDLAGYLGAVESGRSFGTLAGDTGVGTRGGSQDHTAILCARPRRLVGYRFAPVVLEDEVALDDALTFVVASSGVKASKTGAARDRYNRAAALVATLLDRWREATGEDVEALGVLQRRDAAALDRLRELLADGPPGPFTRDELLARLDQFEQEALVFVPAATRALARGDLARFGTLVDASQAAAERGLGNQVPETIALARAARTHGAAAASAFGAGFGGSVWALVERRDVDRFTQVWRDDYGARFPEQLDRAQFFRTDAGPPLVRL